MAEYVWIAWLISGASFLVSLGTAWLTLGRRGKVVMTRPTVIAFLNTAKDGPKVYLRTLLRSTAQRGNVIESMYVRVRRHESGQNFNVWVYGEKQLARGSGLFLTKDGIVCHHHFMPPKDVIDFRFVAGEYVIEIYATSPKEAKPLLLFTEKLHLSPEHADALAQGAGVHFDWGPDSGKYFPHIPVPRQLAAANDTESGWPLQAAMTIRLIPHEGESVTFKDNQTNVVLIVGLRNMIPVAISPRRLMLRWTVKAGSFHMNDVKEVIEDFPDLQPYVEYPVTVVLPLPKHDGPIDMLASTHIAGTFFATIEGSDRTERAELLGFSWAKVGDERKSPRQLTP